MTAILKIAFLICAIGSLVSGFYGGFGGAAVAAGAGCYAAISLLETRKVISAIVGLIVAALILGIVQWIGSLIGSLF